jgi:hypothetical protein
VLAHRRLDHQQEARDALDRLHKLMQKPEFGLNDEAISFLREAETLE